MEMSLTKIEVARRQLATAIRLLFRNKDSVSILSLAANAWEIIDVLCNKDDIGSLSNETREHIEGQARLKYDYINSPYRNFFKHANSDPDAVLPPLDERNVEAVIFLAVEDYIRLNKKSPIEFQVFQLWYLALNSEKLSAESSEEIMRSIEAAFPGIQGLPRMEQVSLGHKVLEQAKVDTSLINDNRTEAAFSA